MSPFVVSASAEDSDRVLESTSGTLVSRPLDKLPMGIYYRFEGQYLRLSFGARPHVAARRADEPARMQALRAQVTAVAEEYYRRVAELAGEAPSPSENLATELAVALSHETGDPYREYRLAVFQPGLSPEQRRLLFHHAIERLHVRLPDGELQPRRRRGPR